MPWDVSSSRITGGSDGKTERRGAIYGADGNKICRVSSVEADHIYREPLVELAKAQDVDVTAIKAIAKRPRPGETRAFETWDESCDSVWFLLSRAITRRPWLAITGSRL